jgi:hypothetical protein
MAQPRVRLEGQSDAEAEAAEAADGAELQAAEDASAEVRVAEEVAAAVAAAPAEVAVGKFGDLTGVDEVTCLVPKNLRLHLDGNSAHIEIAAGMQSLPRAVAEHWYAKANGVQIAVS